MRREFIFLLAFFGIAIFGGGIMATISFMSDSPLVIIGIMLVAGTVVTILIGSLFIWVFNPPPSRPHVDEGKKRDAGVGTRTGT